MLSIRGVLDVKKGKAANAELALYNKTRLSVLSG
jgi:hypothetical protein